MDHCSIQGQYNTYMYSYMYFIVYHVQLFKLCLFLFAEVSGNVMNVRQGSKGRRDQKLLEKRPERASEVSGASGNNQSSIDANGIEFYVIFHQFYIKFCMLQCVGDLKPVEIY